MVQQTFCKISFGELASQLVGAASHARFTCSAFEIGALQNGLTGAPPSAAVLRFILFLGEEHTHNSFLLESLTFQSEYGLCHLTMTFWLVATVNPASIPLPCLFLLSQMFSLMCFSEQAVGHSQKAFLVGSQPGQLYSSA